ncbi:MAG: DUF2783 domain-containing protein [Rubrivivax sp.]
MFDAHLEHPDDFYAALLAAHEGLSAEQSQALNARLVLILANAVGRQDLLLQALDAARRSL